MKKYLFYFISAALLFSCSKESVNVVPEQDSAALIHKTFTVSSDDTKTYLDGMSVKWASDDKINVVAYGTGNQYTFTLKSGANTSTAVFEGDIDAADGEETQFIAVYPDVNVSITKDADPEKEIIEYLGSASGDHVKYFVSDVTPVKAIKDGFDGRYAPMTAVLSGDKFTFRHGAAYFKLKMSVDGVKTIKLESGGESGKARFNGRPKYYMATGLNSTVEGAKAYIYASPEVGTFEKDAVYYIPVLTKQSNVGTLFITYTLEDGTTTSGIKTNVLGSTKLTAGLVYDLGTPPVSFTPTIHVTAPSKLNADATNGSFTYSVSNPDGVSEVTAALKSGTWITSVAASAGTVTFNCTANTGDERQAVITLSYLGAEDVDVTITQKAGSGGAKESHAWDFSALTDEQMTAITGLAADAKATAGQTWNFGDGLTMVTNSSSKWNNQTINDVNYKWVATGGKYGSSQKFFQFTTESIGTVTVLYASGKDENARALTINANGTETTDSANVSSGTEDLKTVTFSSVAAGTIKLYSKAENIRVFSISFLEN